MRSSSVSERGPSSGRVRTAGFMVVILLNWMDERDCDKRADLHARGTCSAFTRELMGNCKPHWPRDHLLKVRMMFGGVRDSFANSGQYRDAWPMTLAPS